MTDTSTISYDQAVKKYQQMVTSRKESYDIDINDYLPSISEMLKEDCVWDVLDSMKENLGDKDSDKEKTAYYTEKPPLTKTGYYEDKQCFVLRASKFNISKGSWDLGNIEGDTWTFKISDLDCGDPFTINDVTYKTFQEYALENQQIKCANIQIKSASIDTSNICHYTVCPCPTKDANIISMDYKKALLKGYSVMPHKINRNKSDDPAKWTITDYKEGDNIRLLENNGSYFQIIDDLNAKDYVEDVDIKDGYNYYVIAASNNFGSETVKDGYKAQSKVKEIIENKNIKDIVVIIDRNAVIGNKIAKTSFHYNSFMFDPRIIGKLIDDVFNKDIMDFSLSSAEFLPFGCDRYGQLLGNVWVQIGTKDGDTWINLSKYVASGTNFTDTNPSFNGSLSEIYNGTSEVFKQWNDASTNFEYVDSLTADGKKSYNERIKLHKKLTGINFSEARDHTVLLGDVLFIIPPEAIHTSSSLDYEKLPILRGKGSMMKNRANVEELLELELYFNNEYGINGIPYETTTPNGDSITYYMNGLRALVAQFRIAPFLPIENHYINDVLNIEAVSLVNINVSTVDGFPKLLKVILTLRDFNYRVFMPDLPLPDYSEDSNEISETQPIFAQHFNWELFRYYYQRGIINGEELTKHKYNSYSYIDFIYSNKNVYKHADLKDSDFELYVPDISWLKYALQAKKAKDMYGQIDLSGLEIDKDKNKENDKDKNNTDNTTKKPTVTDFMTELNGNKPYFKKSELTTKSKESYSELDGLGRCGTAFAIIGKDIMPTEERGDISSVTPSGWKNKTYTSLQNEYNSKGYLYNRCHLIGYQLTGENANKKNLITGTVFLNVGDRSDTPKYGGMLYYENKVKKYLDNNPNNHVAYRVTPVFDGNNLVASAVTIEGYSVEDKGKGICFNVYLRNIQPGITIDYATGDSGLSTNETEEIVRNYYNYKEPRNMTFVPYLQNDKGKSIPIELDGLSFDMANYFTETHLKASDGFAPQYMGGSDVSIELKMTITDEYVIGALKNLPHMIMSLIRTYRRVMPCFPLKIKNEYLQMIGVNEVVFDNVSVSTKPGHPGVYDVVLKLTSMDRTMRQRESLKKADVDSITSSSAAYTIGNYFNLQTSLAHAELYPDLDLPTIEELSKLGWKFAKWANEDRIYVDPDFYMCYSFQYASKLVKEVINSILYRISYEAGREDSTDKKAVGIAKDINALHVEDSVGVGMDLSAGVDYDGVDVDAERGFANEYNIIMNKVQDGANKENETRSTRLNGTSKDQTEAIIKALEYLTATGIENGWQIAPGWYAHLCDEYINDCIEDLDVSGIDKQSEIHESDNAYITEIYDMRHRAIMLIDSILDKPITTSKDKSDDHMQCVYDAVNNVLNTGKGRQLLNLLCPMQDTSDSNNDTGGNNSYRPNNGNVLELDPKFFEEAVPIRWLQGYLFSLACTRSGEENYSPTKKDNSWQPNQWQNQDVEYDPNDVSSGNMNKVQRKEKLPYVKIKQGRGVAGDGMLTKYDDSWKEDGISFGAGQLTIFNRSEIKEKLQPESKIKYFNYDYLGGASEYYNNMYHKTKRAGRKRFCETGFIDPYYNFAGYKSKEGKDYIERISTCLTANYEALFREVLTYLKYLIMEGYIFSEVDVIAGDWDKILDDFVDTARSFKNNVRTDVNYFASQGNIHNSVQDALIKDEDEKGEDGYGDNGDEKEELDKLAQIANTLKEDIPKSYSKIFCARLIYPFALAAVNGSKDVLNKFKSRDYDALDVHTLSSSVGGTNNDQFDKFLNAMFGTGMIGSCNVMDSSECTSNTQKAFNTIMSEAFTYMSSDPRCYALHSMYDMCVTDKRGRLLRAFPCYYIFFVDEGRTIGTWRLFDNFYNMSSISNLQVVKSRKIPADTCTFTMSNMFMSYADTYDNTVYQQYVDVYGFGDVFASIFSPRAYISKEDMVRQRKQLTDTTAIAPGVRIHVRMGYGSDGSKLPIVFNGKVAEVNCGETVDIVAQGDGHELNNPLNVLGELTAINLDESQGWFTLFKDIRGSLARGGQTPRNLLAKLATAQYGGAFKTIVRELTEGRFYYDNPFGIYHFGDRRFKDIFEDSEIVQNMYEVSNKNILNGINDLLDDVSTVNVAPTINCNIQDKTMWDIGHLCANSGDDFFFAVRDFGLRSTMCLCKANHYYAYEYVETKDNDVIAEKRKPFQQFHYYDSNNDIIYNSLKASETNMKTNAVGTWEGTDYLWGTRQQSVGPIYLDINIYPEYQKSMMVETGLIAGGDGGIDIPLFNAISERFNYNEYDGRVNKSLAEKVTTNVLRQSVKDMYEGEICVIGDASLKPYDRVTLMDMYEDVSGDVEVETVIHSMNIETGFTTTFVPDVIVRAEHTCQEFGYQSVTSSLILGLVGSVTLKGLLMSVAQKGGAGLLKLGSTSVVQKVGAAIVTDTVKKTAITSFVEGFTAAAAGTEVAKDAGILVKLGAIFTNPVALACTAIAGASVFALMQCGKEIFYRWCRNIQALTVFPITKNGRLLIAGMAGHKGSVYGYKYPESAIENSVQSLVMNFLEGTTDIEAVNWIGKAFGLFLNDDNYKIVRDKWINNLGLTNSDDIINNDAADARNTEAFYQYISNAISKEYASRAATIATLKTKPRVKSFGTTTNVSGKSKPRSSEVYLKYQIGGVHDLEGSDEDPTRKAVSSSELPTNERIKRLHPLEDEPDIKMAKIEGVHPVIKKFTLLHSTSPLHFNLKMENENTRIQYIAEGQDPAIFDLPMLQEDALLLIKLIINSDNLKGKTVTFMSGTRVNSTSSWKSTGFWFSLSCDDMTALEAASAELKKDTGWISDRPIFGYKRTDSTIQYTVYAPIETSDKTIYDHMGDDDE